MTILNAFSFSKLSRLNQLVILSDSQLLLKVSKNLLKSNNIYLELGLTDYYDVIKKPMDFDTLKNNLMDSKYATYEDFLLDIQLIWDNCKLYNQAGTPIAKISDRMERLTKKEIGKWKSKNSL